VFVQQFLQPKLSRRFCASVSFALQNNTVTLTCVDLVVHHHIHKQLIWHIAFLEVLGFRCWVVCLTD